MQHEETPRSRTRSRRRPFVLAAILALALAASGCASDKSFGEGVNLKTSAPPASETPTKKKATKKASSSPKTQASKTASKPPQRTFTLVIQGGQCGIGLCPYDPTQFQVAKGTKIIVKNESDQPRSWTSDDGKTFDSGMIKAGGTFTYTANTPGRFPFHDEAARYVTGEMIVAEVR